jgi:hypothetical protein
MTVYDPTVSSRAPRFSIVFIPLLALAVLAGPLAGEAQ